MAPISLCFFSLLWLLSFSFALDVKGKIYWNADCPGIKELRSSKVVLDDGRMKGSIIQDGSFVIPNVPTGTYILSVVSPNYSFDQFRIDVLEAEVETRPYVLGTPLNPASPVLLTHPFTLIPRQKHAYFVPRESFDLVAMFSNPMMLMMVAGGVMMLAMPYIMKNMDPDSMEEFKQQHAKVQNAMAGGSIKSGFSTILGNDEPLNTSARSASKTIPPSGIKNRSNKNKR